MWNHRNSKCYTKSKYTLKGYSINVNIKANVYLSLSSCYIRTYLGWSIVHHSTLQSSRSTGSPHYCRCCLALQNANLRIWENCCLLSTSIPLPFLCRFHLSMYFQSLCCLFLPARIGWFLLRWLMPNGHCSADRVLQPRSTSFCWCSSSSSDHQPLPSRLRNLFISSLSQNKIYW